MSVLGNILSKIFHPRRSAAKMPPPTNLPDEAPKEPVDVEAILNDMAHHTTQKLNWHTSIVDLMKLLDMDSSLESRKELARELHYTGDMSQSAEMNIWLHKQVMQKLAENGGKIPDAMKH